MPEHMPTLPKPTKSPLVLLPVAGNPNKGIKVTIQFERNTQRDGEIVRLAIENPNEITNRELGERYGISGERVRQIISDSGEHKPRKLGALYDCKKAKCKRKFRGTRSYSGHKARYCNKHRRK